MYCALTDGSTYGWIFPLLCLAMMALCILFATRGAGCFRTPPWRQRTDRRRRPDRGLDSSE